jgi:hypothetical protein
MRPNLLYLKRSFSAKCKRNGKEIRGYSKPTNKTVIPATFTYFAIASYIMSWQS